MPRENPPFRENAPQKEPGGAESEQERMREKMREIKGLYPEYMRSRYASIGAFVQENFEGKLPIAESGMGALLPFLDTRGEKAGNEKAAEGDVQSLLRELFDGQSDKHADAVRAIAAWVEEDPVSRVPYVEKTIGETVESSRALPIGVLLLLGEIRQHSRRMMVEDEIAFALERAWMGGHILPPELCEQIGVLNRLDLPAGRTILHKMLDFIGAHMVTVQDHVEQQIEDETGNGYASFFLKIRDVLAFEIPHATNYLVKKHLEDVVDLIHASDTTKEGALSGVPGGNTDETIYRFRHLAVSYSNRISRGIREGYPILNPVLPIAPGYLAYYDASGRIEKVYPDAPSADRGQKEKEYTAENNPDDTHIYGVLNAPLPSRLSHQSNTLSKLQDIWRLYDTLKKTGRRFFFDLTQIRTEELHPMVLAEIMSHNEEYMREEEGKEHAAEPMPEEAYLKKLFPLGNVSAQKRYNYEYISSLQMRKKIEDDFGFDLSVLSVWEQRLFLSFLERQPVETVGNVQKLVSAYGTDALVTFLSIDIDETSPEMIFSIHEKYSKEVTAAIFQKFGALSREAEKTDQYAQEFFSGKEGMSNENVLCVTKEMMHRARNLLAQYADNESEGGRILEDLDDIRADVLLFAHTFRLASETRNFHFEDIHGIELNHKDSSTLTPEEKAQMVRTFVANRRSNVIAYPKEWRDKRKQEFSDLLDTPGKEFYLLTHDTSVVAFLHMEPLGENALYLGSVNVDTEGRGKKIGGSFLRAVLEQEGKTKPIELIVNSGNAVAKSYEKDFWFQIIETMEDYHGSGQRYYRMRRPPGGEEPRQG